MKDGAILANTGHFDVEINVKQLNEIAVKKRVVKPDLEEFTLPNKRKIYLLAQGRLVNLACAEGHPSEVMMMSFGNQALVAEYFVKNAGLLEDKVYEVPEEIDYKIAELTLKAKGIKIDKLSKAQKEYLNSWQEGT